MKFQKYFLFLIIACSLVALAHASEVYKYNVPKGALHSSGSAEVKDLEIDKKFVLNIKFQLKKKALVPIDDEKLKGETDYELPIDFKTERGYQDLEALKVIDLEEAHLKFVKRENYLNYPNAYFFEVHPKNGRSVVNVIYHPDHNSIGWVRIDIFLIINKLGIDKYKITLESLQ